MKASARSAPIRFYQRFISPAFPRRCKYHPTCSDYAVQAIQRYGILKGTALAAWRLLRCNPFSHGGYDPVPSRRDSAPHLMNWLNLFADAHGGTPVIQPLIDFFHWILIHIHDVIGSWGWSIIALTVLVRACLLPLTFKQFHSMQRLAHLQPEMKKLQEKYKGDKERMNQEMMKFYRENKVNPFSSCLPMVAQFPVFIALYYMLRVDLRYDICPNINDGRGDTGALRIDGRVAVPVHQ